MCLGSYAQESGSITVYSIIPYRPYAEDSGYAIFQTEYKSQPAHNQSVGYGGTKTAPLVRYTYALF